MFPLLILLAATAAATEKQLHPAMDNALLSQIRKNSPADLLSSSSGAPVSYCEVNNSRLGPLIRNKYFMEHMTSLVQERTPARPVHAIGSGAFGYFEVTHDISNICKASFLSEVGKRSPVAVRFSPSIGDKGRSELKRGLRGFAVKLYTDDGNFDLPCFNMPVAFTKDPNQFVKFLYYLKKDPSLYLHDPLRLWNLILAIPESFYMFLLTFGKLGIPLSYRHMPGSNIHSLQVANEQGDQHFIRWHFIPDAGIKHLGSVEAAKIGSEDPDYYTRDLFNSIKNADYPSWTVYIQIITEEDVKRCGNDVFDVTRKLPVKEFPLHQVGKMVLDRNPKNYFAEVDSLAFCPANLVDGILGAPDKLYEARRFAYKDSQMHRMGPDFDKIPVNCPLQFLNDNADSIEELDDYESTKKIGLLKIVQGKSYNFDQVEEYYEKEMTSEERDLTIENIIYALSPACPSVIDKVIERLTTIHPGLGDRVARGIIAIKNKKA